MDGNALCSLAHLEGRVAPWLRPVHNRKSIKSWAIHTVNIGKLGRGLQYNTIVACFLSCFHLVSHCLSQCYTHAACSGDVWDESDSRVSNFGNIWKPCSLIFHDFLWFSMNFPWMFHEFTMNFPWCSNIMGPPVLSPEVLAHRWLSKQRLGMGSRRRLVKASGQVVTHEARIC